MRWGISAAVLGVVLTGCATPTASTVIRWTRLPAAAKAEGKVAIASVLNKRPADRGGSDLNWIGNTRNTYGMPSAMRVDDAQYTAEPMALDETVRRFLSEGLRASGIGVAAAGEPGTTSLLAVEIRDFFADGYNSYSGRVALDLVVLDPTTQAERRRVTVSGEGASGRAGTNCEAWEGMTASMAYADFCYLFDKALTAVQAELSAVLSKPDLRAALLTAAAAAPASAPAAPAVSGCAKDTDCKGERICVDGKCVNPK